MKVKIVHNKQKLFNVTVTEKTTIAYLKHIITQRIGMRPEDQVLTLRGIFLEDSHPLGDYRLPRPDVVVPLDLYIRANHKRPAQIQISFSANKVLPLSIQLDAKVKDLRAAIKEEFGVPVKKSDVRLVFDHWILEDSEALETYGIKKDSCILFVRHLFTDYSRPLTPQLLLPQSNGVEKSIEVLSPEMDALRKLKLYVKSGEEVFSVSLSKDGTLQDVSEHIERRTGIPSKHQSFALSEGLPHVVDLTKSLASLGLTDGDTVYLTDVRESKENTKEKALENDNVGIRMTLRFRDQQNDFSIPVALDATVQDAIDALRRAISGSRGPLWLKNTVDGNFMQDYGVKLTDLGVKDGTVIEYVYLPAKLEWSSQ